MTEGQRTRVVFLDGLRAIASVAVLLQHYLENVVYQTFQPFLQFGPGLFGVVLFFLISGYVMPFSMRNGLHPASFLMRRIFRILPLYVCVVTVLIMFGCIGVAPFANRIEGLNSFDYVANYLLFYEYVGVRSVLGVSWTLSVEFAWYIFFTTYFVMFGHRKVANASVLFSLCLIALAVLSVLLDTRFPLGRMGMIGAAMLGYVYSCQSLGFVRRRDVTPCLILFLLATGLAQWVCFGHFEHPNMSFFNGISAWAIAIAFFASVAGLGKVRRIRLWKNSVLQRVGQLSFGIYLLHMPVLLVLGNFLDGWILLGWATSVTIALSAVSYRWIELPGIAAGRFLGWWIRAGAENQSLWILLGSARHKRISISASQLP